MPVHRVRVEGGHLRELYVSVESDVADGYEGALGRDTGRAFPTPAPGIPPVRSGHHLGRGAKPPSSACFWTLGPTRPGALLNSGFALTIDYGRAAGDLYDPALRRHGALVTYRAHRQTDAPFHDVGRQDITAQVDFTSVQMAAETAGLTTVGNVPQGSFLQRLGLQTIRRNAAPLDTGGGGWITLPVGQDGLPPDMLPDAFGAPPDDARAWRANLTHLAQPGGLGDFRVLLQAKGLSPERAVAALSWLDGEPAEHGYTPPSLAAMIPPDALTMGPERTRLTQ